VSDSTDKLGDSPHPPPKASLGGAFGRAGGLAGLELRRPAPPAGDRTPPPPPPAPARDEQGPPKPPADEQAKPADAASPASERRQGRRRPAATRNPASGRPRVVIVYLPITVKERLDQQRAATGRAITRLALEAITATHKRLPDLLREPELEPDRDELFTYDAPRRHGEPKVQVTLRLREDQLAVIDGLVGEYNAPDRSALVAAALRGHLP
jgi:hypothetical protein